jgi:hypothetical protein
MKTETVVNIALFAGLALAIVWIIKEGRSWLDVTIGDNPLGLVGTDEDPGILTAYEIFKSGGVPPEGTWWDWDPFGFYGHGPRTGKLGAAYRENIPEGSIWDWDPFGFFGRGSAWGPF